jgi:hypothetical protein
VSSLFESPLNERSNTLRLLRAMAYDLEDHLRQTPNGSKSRQSLRVRVCGSFAALGLMVPLKEERFATDWEARKGRGAWSVDGPQRADL